MSDRSLTAYGLMAKRHWQEFCPQRFRQLQAEGKLEEMLYEAQETTLDEMEILTRKMERDQQMTPGQAQTAAWELVRENIFSCRPRARTTERSKLSHHGGG